MVTPAAFAVSAMQIGPGFQAPQTNEAMIISVQDGNTGIGLGQCSKQYGNIQ